MRFNEFNNVNEDIGLPTDKGVTDKFGSYRPGSDKKVWGTGSTAKNIPSSLDDVRPGNTDKKVWGTGSTAKPPYPVDSLATNTGTSYNLKDDPLGKASAGSKEMGPNISSKPSTTATTTPTTATTTKPIPPMSTADRFRQVDAGNIKPNIKPNITPSTVAPAATATTATTATPGAAQATGFNAGQKVKAGIDSLRAGGINGLKAGAQTLGKKALGRVIPGAASVMDTADAIRRYNDDDKSGAVIAALGAAGGLVPGLGLPVSLGAAGLNQAIDAYKRMPAKETPPQQAPTQQQAAPTQQAPTQQSTIQPPAQPRQLEQPRKSYAGTAGAQAIQRANPDIIKNVNDITAGDTINLPNGTQYTIKPGDTLDKIAQNQSTAQAPTVTPRPSITQTQSSNTPSTTQATNTTDNSPDDTFRNQNLERMKDQANQASTTYPSKTIVPPATKDASQVQAEEVNPLHRIKSLAGLK
jgi:hypothetical protein